MATTDKLKYTGPETREFGGKIKGTGWKFHIPVATLDEQGNIDKTAPRVIQFEELIDGAWTTKTEDVPPSALAELKSAPHIEVVKAGSVVEAAPLVDVTPNVRKPKD